ncbi:hypothetical protein Tco_0579684 [Tanacetum coccineum]
MIKLKEFYRANMYLLLKLHAIFLMTFKAYQEDGYNGWANTDGWKPNSTYGSVIVDNEVLERSASSNERLNFHHGYTKEHDAFSLASITMIISDTHYEGEKGLNKAGLQAKGYSFYNVTSSSNSTKFKNGDYSSLSTYNRRHDWVVNVQERVHDYQLGIESYQIKVSLTAPTLTVPAKKERRAMDIDELQKFYDATLERVLKNVKEITMEARHGFEYPPGRKR